MNSRPWASNASSVPSVEETRPLGAKCFHLPSDLPQVAENRALGLAAR